MEPQLPSSSDVETTAIQSENITNAPSNTGILCSNDRYTISFEGNNCYINFSSGNDTSPEEGFSQVGSIDFTSLSEMKNHFTNNLLTEEQMLVIRSTFTDETNGIRICDLNTLYNPTMPDGVLVEQVTLWRAAYYFTMSSAVGSGALTVASESTYQFHYDRDFKDIEGYQITRQENGTIEDIPCEIIEYTVPGNGDQYRDIYLTIQDGDRTLNIELSYCLKNSQSTTSRPVSETLPWRVLIFGENNGQHFYAYLRDFTTAPTVEWLTSFGITPYVENNDTAKF